MSNETKVSKPPKGPGGRGMMVVEKPKNLKKSLKKLMAFCRPYWAFILVALITAALGTLFQIIGPDKIKDLTNEITLGLRGEINLIAVRNIGLLLVGLYVASSVLTYVQSFLMVTVTQRISKSLRRDISEKINHLPFSYFDQVSFGDVLSRVTNDVDTISQTLNQSMGQLVSAVTMFVGSLIMMFSTSWILSLTAIGATVIGFVFMFFIMSKSQRFFVSQQEELGNINGHIEEIFSGQQVVKVYNATRQATEEFDSINEKLYTSAWKSQFLSGLMMPLMGFIGNLGYVAVCVVGAYLTMKGHISFGVIVAFTL